MSYLQLYVVEACSHIRQSLFSENPLSIDSEIQGNAAKWDWPEHCWCQLCQQPFMVCIELLSLCQGITLMTVT